MPKATLIFFDGEVAECELDAHGFDGPALRVSFLSSANTSSAILGLAAIKYVVYADPPAPVEFRPELARKVAIHFTDGEVVRALAGPELAASAHGTVMEMEDPQRESHQCVGIPFASVKGIFEIREWDSRVARFDEELDRVTPSRPPQARDDGGLSQRLREAR